MQDLFKIRRNQRAQLPAGSILRTVLTGINQDCVITVRHKALGERRANTLAVGQNQPDTPCANRRDGSRRFTIHGSTIRRDPVKFI